MEYGILVVDDEPEIADLVELYLKNEGYQVTKCTSGREAFRLIESGPFDLAVLDIMLPDVDGFTLCRNIREKYTYPIIMLTAKTAPTDKISGLSLGADDYVTKPFLPLELVARVKAQLRRYLKYNTGVAEDKILTHGGLLLNTETHQCYLNERLLQLTPTEFTILRILLQEKGKVVSSETLFRSVWGEEYYSKNNSTITVHIRHLREKMGDSFERPKYIKTIWGVGYQIEET